MTTAKKNENEESTEVVYEDPTVIVGEPKKKKKKKKKKRYSRSLSGIQEFEVAFTKAEKRVAKAVNDGLAEWINLREKSARKKRNGAIRDSLRNGSKAMGKLLSVAARAPSDYIESMADSKIGKRLSKIV